MPNRGVLSRWRAGRVCLFDEDKSIRIMEMLKEQPPAYNNYSEPVYGKRKRASASSPYPNGMSRSEQLWQLIKEKLKRERDSFNNK